MNNWNFVANLARDAEVRHTPKGDAVSSFSVAVNSGYGDKAVTTWANCNLWGKQAESLAPYLKKGTKVAISGEVTLRQYATKDGIEKQSLDVRVTSITLVGSKSDNNTSTSDNNATKASQNDNADPMDFEDSIPFN